MGSVGTVMASLVALLLLGLPVLLVGSLVLFSLLAPFLPASPTVSRTSFTCPGSKRRVTADFESWAGTEGPADVVSCSAFADPRRVECKKDCLGLAHIGSVASPMMPRYALVAGGTVYRA